MMLIIISLQVNHLSLLFLVERAANHCGSRCLQNDGRTDRFDMPQFMELCTLTSTPKGYSFAACYCPEDGCTATDLRRQVEFNGSKGSALQDRVQMPTRKKFSAFVTHDLCHRVYLRSCVQVRRPRSTHPCWRHNNTCRKRPSSRSLS